MNSFFAVKWYTIVTPLAEDFSVFELKVGDKVPIVFFKHDTEFFYLASDHSQTIMLWPEKSFDLRKIAVLVECPNKMVFSLDQKCADIFLEHCRPSAENA